MRSLVSSNTRFAAGEATEVRLKTNEKLDSYEPNWSYDRSTPMSFRPSRNTTSIFSNSTKTFAEDWEEQPAQSVA